MFVFLAEKSDPKPGGMTQEVGQLLQDMGDDVYQQYRSLTRQSSDFDTQSGFSINVSQFQPPVSFSLSDTYMFSPYLGLCYRNFKGINFDVPVNYLWPVNEDKFKVSLGFFSVWIGNISLNSFFILIFLCPCSPFSQSLFIMMASHRL